MNLVQRSATAESAKDAAGEASVVLRSKKTGPRAGSTAYSDFLTKLSGSASASHQLAVEEEDSDEEGLLAESRAERARQNALDVRRSWVERMEADEDAPDKPPAAAQTCLAADHTCLAADQTCLAADQTALAADPFCPLRRYADASLQGIRQMNWPGKMLLASAATRSFLHRSWHALACPVVASACRCASGTRDKENVLVAHEAQ